MPIFEKGYRRWDGPLRGRFYRWWTITRTGIGQTRKSKWLKRFVLIAWLPILYYGLAFFAVGRMTDVSTMEQAKDMWQFQMLRGMFGGPLAEKFLEDPASYRSLIWSLLIHLFMHYTQIFCVMITVAIVGPRLVSEDMNSRALSIYFSRPLGRFDYILGKFGVVAFWVSLVSLLPAIGLYALSIVFSPGLSTLTQTIGVVPRIFAYSGVLMLATGLPMLALSSLVKSPRMLGFIWAGFWVMSYVAYKVLSQALFPVFGRTPSPDNGDWTGMISYSTNLDAVATGIFNTESRLRPLAELSHGAMELLNQISYGHHWGWSLLILGCLSGISLAVVYWRIRAPEEK